MHSHPNIDLGDKIWRINNEKREEIGTVTEINWDRVRGGLEIQFSPKENAKVNVGEQVWIKINPTN